MNLPEKSEQCVLHILLIEDDPDDLELFKIALEEIDPKIRLWFADGCRMAMELLNVSVRFPDIIFLDLHMPVMDGFECLKEIRNESGYDAIPVIFYTASRITDDLLI